MVLQIRRFKVKQGDPYDICNQAAREVPPLLEKIPGFVDYYVVNGKDDSVFSVSIFQDQSGLDQAFETVRQWSRQNVGQKLGEPEIIQGDVIYSASEKAKAA